VSESERLAFEGGEIHLLRGGDGPPLLFLHAAGGAGIWAPFHEGLSRHFTVYAPDHPGFGQSDELPEVEDVDDLVYHYLELMDRLELERPIVVGASFGGWVAAELAVHSPERVERLVLLGAVGLRIPGHYPADLFFMKPEELPTAVFKDQSVAAQAFPAEPSVDEILQIHKDMSAFARFAWSPFCNDPKLERRLHRISAPTLVAWGDDDRVVPRIHGERYAERIRDARFELVENCGHAPHQERPEATVDAIVAFAGQQREAVA
jgi:pimeloyl-ACP methyl ester carboxylesterase